MRASLATLAATWRSAFEVMLDVPGLPGRTVIAPRQTGDVALEIPAVFRAHVVFGLTAFDPPGVSRSLEVPNCQALPAALPCTPHCGPCTRALVGLQLGGAGEHCRQFSAVGGAAALNGTDHQTWLPGPAGMALIRRTCRGCVERGRLLCRIPAGNRNRRRSA